LSVDDTHAIDKLKGMSFKEVIIDEMGDWNPNMVRRWVQEKQLRETTKLGELLYGSRSKKDS